MKECKCGNHYFKSEWSFGDETVYLTDEGIPLLKSDSAEALFGKYYRMLHKGIPFGKITCDKCGMEYEDWSSVPNYKPPEIATFTIGHIGTDMCRITAQDIRSEIREFVDGGCICDMGTMMATMAHINKRTKELGMEARFEYVEKS